MSRIIEKFENVTVDYDKLSGYIYINDSETGEQLAVLCVSEED